MRSARVKCAIYRVTNSPWLFSGAPFDAEQSEEQRRNPGQKFDALQQPRTSGQLHPACDGSPLQYVGGPF